MKSYFYVFSRNIIAGANTPLLKKLNDTFPTYSLLLTRQFLVWIITLFMIDFNTLKDDYEKLSSLDKGRIVLSGSIAAFCSYLVFYTLDYIPVTLFALVEQSFLLIVGLIFGFIFLKEQLSLETYFGVLITLIGLLFVMTKGNLTDFSSLPLYGILIMALYSVISTIGSIISVKVVKQVRTNSYMFMNTSVRVLFFIPFPFIFKEQLSTFTSELTLVLLFLLLYSALSMFIVGFLGNKSVKTIGYSKTQMFLPMIPVFSCFSSMFIFQEWFNTHQYIGLIIVVFGIYMMIGGRNGEK